MQEINKIFQLHPDRNYSEASCILISGDNKRMKELIHKAIYHRLKVKEEWITCNFQWLEKNGRKKTKLNPDYFSYPPDFHVFSDKAVIFLKDFFENGELLDMFLTSSNHEISHYNIFNNFNIFDCLDMKSSELKLHSNGLIERFIKPIFFVDKIKAHIFRIPQSNLTTFVTNVFVENVLENKLVGFYFIPLCSVDGILGEPITTDYKKRRKKL